MNRVSTWWARISRYEFWPFHLFYLPVYLFYGWLALKCRSFFFFTSANPCIDFGGMIGEKKSEVFQLIPNEYLPLTKSFHKETGAKEVISYLQSHSLSYPIICKPDVGERGYLVEKIIDEEQLKFYIRNINQDFLIQEYVDLPLELGVFYVRHPDWKKGEITSIVEKGFLSVVGDGLSTVDHLLKGNVRAELQLDRTNPTIKRMLDQVPPAGEELFVESIGNHCRGTTFLNSSDMADDHLAQVFDHLAQQIPEFYFGRFDIRCSSFEELGKGINFKILELNGAGAEPAHIYQPGYSILRAYKEIIWHLNLLADISIANKERGFPYWSFPRGLKRMKAYWSS